MKTSSISQRSERRRQQNRRAQENLRKKRREHVEDLQRQIQSLKAQAQAYTEAQLQVQNVDPEHGGEIPEPYDSYNSFPASMGDVPSYLVDNSFLTDSSSVSSINPFLSSIQQPPIPSHPSSNTVLQNMVPALQQYYCAFDALAKNASLLGISPESFLSTNSNSIFYSPLQSLTSISVLVEHLPPEFHPTLAQLSYPHQPWIDCVPIRDLRSRIIFAASHRPPFLDSLDLWHDVLSDGLSCAADPKDASLWVMNNEFMQKWQLILTIDLLTLEKMCLTSNPPLRKMSLSDP